MMACEAMIVAAGANATIGYWSPSWSELIKGGSRSREHRAGHMMEEAALLSERERCLAAFGDGCDIEVRQRNAKQPHAPRRREERLKKIETELLDACS
jgi:hypothetical protein